MIECISQNYVELEVSIIELHTLLRDQWIVALGIVMLGFGKLRFIRRSPNYGELDPSSNSMN